MLNQGNQQIALAHGGIKNSRSVHPSFKDAKLLNGKTPPAKGGENIPDLYFGGVATVSFHDPG